MELASVSDEDLVAAFRKLRKSRDDAKRKFTDSQAPTLDALRRIETEAQRRLLERESSSFKTAEGTCFSKDDTSVTAPNKTVFLDWIKEKGQWDLLDIRPSKTAVMGYVEGCGEIPPGLDVSIRKKVQFNAPRNK